MAFRYWTREITVNAKHDGVKLNGFTIISYLMKYDIIYISRHNFTHFVVGFNWVDNIKTMTAVNSGQLYLSIPMV